MTAYVRDFELSDQGTLEEVQKRFLARWKPDMMGGRLGSIMDPLNLLRATVEDEDGVIGFGLARLTVDLSLLVDPPTEKKRARNAIAVFIEESTERLAQRGLKEAHAFVLPQFVGIPRFLERNGWKRDARTHLICPLRGKQE